MKLGIISLKRQSIIPNVLILFVVKDDYEQKIKDELLKDNPYNINYIFPQQGERITLK